MSQTDLVEDYPPVAVAAIDSKSTTHGKDTGPNRPPAPISPTLVPAEGLISSQKRLANDETSHSLKQVKSEHWTASTRHIPPASFTAQLLPLDTATLSSIGHATSGNMASGTTLIPGPPNPTGSASTELVQIVDNRPIIPIDAIDTLQKTANQMLALVTDRTLRDRENRLFSAVESLMGCLEKHFVPLAAASKAGRIASTKDRSSAVPAVPVISTSDNNTQSVPPSAKPVPSKTSKKSKKSQTEIVPPLVVNSEPTPEALRDQLLNACAIMDIQQTDLAIKDVEIFRVKDDSERVYARFIELVGHLDDGDPVIPLLKQQIQTFIEKVNRQRVQIENIDTHNRRLKDMLKRAGIPLDSERDWAGLRADCEAHKAFYMKQGGDEKSWRDSWDGNGEGGSSGLGPLSLYNGKGLPDNTALATLRRPKGQNSGEEGKEDSKALVGRE